MDILDHHFSFPTARFWRGCHMTDGEDQLLIGWAETEITPSENVLIAGQFHARVSEGVNDPITSTALAIQGRGGVLVIVSCDLVSISDGLRDAVRGRLAQMDGLDGLDPMEVILHGTHTHTGPETRVPRVGAGHPFDYVGIELPVIPVKEYVNFAAGRIAGAVSDAWSSRSPGGFAFGQGYAVVGRNRRWVDREGGSTMYGDTNTPGFSHIEGYEDHSVNVFATYAGGGSLSGLVVNVPCPAQVSEVEFRLSADYWFETREELRRRLGGGLPILAQCSAAGDQSPHLLFDKRSAERMLELSGRTEREEIAHRISGAVEEVLQHAGQAIDYGSPLRHRVEDVTLPTAELTEEDAKKAERDAGSMRKLYEELKQNLDADPSLKNQDRWYTKVTSAYRRMCWLEAVAKRYREGRKRQPAELHVIRMGEMALATNPFEYYLDFGVYIRARSRAVQTFLVQLAGSGTYVPSRRSTEGGGYGSVPASNPVGYQGGWEFAERTIALIDGLWEEPGQ